MLSCLFRPVKLCCVCLFLEMSSCSELKMIALVCLFFNILNWILCLLSSFQAFLSSVLYNLFHFLKCVYCDSMFVLCSPFMALSTIAVLYKSVLSLISVHQPTQGTIDLCGHEHFVTNLTIFRSLPVQLFTLLYNLELHVNTCTTL